MSGLGHRLDGRVLARLPAVRTGCCTSINTHAAPLLASRSREEGAERRRRRSAATPGRGSIDGEDEEGDAVNRRYIEADDPELYTSYLDDDVFSVRVPSAPADDNWSAAGGQQAEKIEDGRTRSGAAARPRQPHLALLSIDPVGEPSLFADFLIKRAVAYNCSASSLLYSNELEKSLSLVK